MRDEPPPAFFVPADGLLVPTERSRGPWDGHSLSGRVISGLLAHEIERSHHDPDFVTARLTVDMFRRVPFEAVAVETCVSRSGHRIRVVDATLLVGDEMVARATAVMLRTGPHPTNAPYRGVRRPIRDWRAVPPWETTTSSFAERSWETRLVSGSFSTGDQVEVWLRPLYPMVLGQDSGAFVELAAAADVSGPASSAAAGGLAFINADITINLAREPVRGPYGFRSLGHLGAAGIGVGSCQVFDDAGPVGIASVAAIANAPRR